MTDVGEPRGLRGLRGLFERFAGADGRLDGSGLAELLGELGCPPALQDERAGVLLESALSIDVSRS